MLRTLDPQFITEREQGLKVFLATILSEPHLSNRLEVKKFLDPKNYSGNFYGEFSGYQQEVGVRTMNFQSIPAYSHISHCLFIWEG